MTTTISRTERKAQLEGQIKQLKNELKPIVAEHKNLLCHGHASHAERLWAYIEEARAEIMAVEIELSEI